VTIPRILSIAGSDSGGGAGIQADIKTVTVLGGHAMTAITAITAQNTLGVTEVLPVPTATVLAQIDAVASDIGVDAIKIGMIGSAETGAAVVDRLRKPDLADVPVVFDPVMVASTGARLTDQSAMLSLTRLLSRASVSTPNVEELHALSGMPVSDELEIADAAAHLIEERGSGPILVTGVCLPDGTILEQGKRALRTDGLIFDFLYLEEDGWQDYVWNAARIETTQDHGTGCTLSSAIATGLAQGKNLQDAIADARLYVRHAMMAAPGLGAGHGPMGHGLGRMHFEA
jgi:hydroxymethylpyrimidine/phosphomethylpyrimidine kinase